jgi:hypothetical protein
MPKNFYVRNQGVKEKNMLVLSRILYGMLLGIALILVSEFCLANQEDREYSVDRLTIGHEQATLYNVDDKFAVVGAYRHYEDTEVEADRVFVGLRAKF